MLLVIPLCFLIIKFIPQIRQLFLQCRQAVLTQTVGLLLQGGLLDLQLQHFTPQFVQLRRHGIHLCLDQGARFVYQVDGFIRQEPVRNITMGQRRRRDQRGVRNLDSMIYLVPLLQSTQDRDRVFHGRLIHQHLLETAFQRRVLLDILTVLIQRRGSDTVEFASGQHGLQHIARIHRAVCLAGSYDQVQLIDEQDNLPLALSHLFQNRFQTFLKFAPVLGACYQRAHIQRENLLILQSFRHIAADNPLRQAFHHGGLADAGFSDQHRIILRLTGQDPNHIPDLRVTSDDRIQLLLSGFLHQVVAVFIQGIISSFRIVRSHPLVPADRRQGLQEFLPGDPVLPEQGLDRGAGVIQQSQEQMFHRDVFVSHPLGFVLGADQRFVQVLADIRLPAGHFHPFIQGFFHSLFK